MATIDQIITELNGFSALGIKKIVSNVTANLIRDTPVDTGWAQSNWVPSIGVRNEGLVGSPESVSMGEQSSGLASVQARYKISDGKVFISNNVLYMLALNDGHSAKAPRMFIEKAIIRGVGETFI